MIYATAIAAAALFSRASADNYKFCVEPDCQDCKVTIDDAGTGFPNCVIYKSDTVFKNQGFKTIEEGGIEAYLHIDDPGVGCAVMVKSPANTDVQGCGFPLGSLKQAGCLPLILKETFMVEFCCGHDNCHDMGAGRRGLPPPKFSPNWNNMLRSDKQIRSGGSGWVYLNDADGNIIQPLEVGTAYGVEKKAAQAISAREDGRCNGDWEGTEPYTKPSDTTQILVHGIAGSATRSLQVSQSWTNGTDFSLGVADVLSLGATFSKSFTETKTETTTQTITVPKGQVGDWGFTATMECTKGHGTCDGKKVEGEICWPKIENGHLVGQNHLIVH